MVAPFTGPFKFFTASAVPLPSGGGRAKGRRGGSVGVFQGEEGGSVGLIFVEEATQGGHREEEVRHRVVGHGGGLVWSEEELGFGMTRRNDNVMLNILLLSFIHHLNPNEGVVFIEHTRLDLKLGHDQNYHKQTRNRVKRKAPDS